MTTMMISEPIACAECGEVGTYVPGVRYFAECSNPECDHEVAYVDLQPEGGESFAFIGGVLHVVLEEES